MSLHFNILEMKVVILAVTFWETKCRGKIVLVGSDTRIVVAYLNYKGKLISTKWALSHQEFRWLVSLSDFHPTVDLFTLNLL